MKTMAPALDLVIASAYTESNDTAPGFPKEAASCTEPCAVTSLPTVEAAVGHGNGGWDEYVPRSKLVLAVGWFMREWGMNASLPLAQRGDPLGGRISYCQAIGLRRSLHKDAAGQPRLDKASGTWSFTCRHDPHNASTFNSCGPHQSPNDQEYEVWHDDAESSRPKFEAVKSAGWRGGKIVNTFSICVLSVSLTRKVSLFQSACGKRMGCGRMPTTSTTLASGQSASRS